MFGNRGDPAGARILTGKGPFRDPNQGDGFNWFLCKSQSVTRNEAVRKHDLFFKMLIDQLLK